MHLCAATRRCGIAYINELGASSDPPPARKTGETKTVVHGLDAERAFTAILLVTGRPK